MTCPNKNTVNYKALLEVYNTDLITTNVIQSWQNSTGSEAIPTVTEAANYAKERKALHNLKQRDFGEALLNNLRRERIIHSFQGVYYINNTEQNVDSLLPNDDIVDSNKKRLLRYLDTNNIPEESIKLSKTPNTYAVTVESSLFSTKDMLEKSRSWNDPRSRQVVSHLMRVFPGLKAIILSPNEAQKKYNLLPRIQKAKVPFSEINSFYVDAEVVLVKGKVTDEIAIEEMLHPFVESIKVDNDSLFKSLLKESRINFPVLNQQIEDAYNKERRISADEREMEIVTQALARHFKKEYEENPTQSFKNVVTKLLEWFQNIIQDFNKYLTGRRIPSRAINPDATLTDIAKQINTQGIRFEIGRRVNGRVRYSLSKSASKIVNQAKSESSTDAQKTVIDQLFHNVTEAKNESETLSANNPDAFINNLVVLNKNNNTFYDLNTNEKYLSASDAIGHGETNNSVIAGMLDNIAAREDYTGDQVDLFEQIRDDVSTVLERDDVLLTNVVFSDPQSKIATIADLVIVDKFGKLRIGKINIQSVDRNTNVILPESSLLLSNFQVSGTLSAEVLDMLEVNLIRRIAENMGYTIQRNEFDTFSINILDGYGLLSSEGLVPRGPGQNLYLVDTLIPTNLYDLSGQQLENQIEQGGLDGQIYDARKDTLADSEISKIEVDINQPRPHTLGAIQNYQTKVTSVLDMMTRLKNSVNKDFKLSGTFESIANTQSIINFAMVDTLNSKDVSVAYTQLLQDVVRQMNNYQDYITDPANLKNREFADYLINFENFIATFEPLYELDSYEELNATQMYLVNNIKGIETKLLGPLSTRKNGRSGLINRALFDFAGEIIIENQGLGFDEGEGTILQSHSGVSFTRADMEDLLSVVPDIGSDETFLRDVATSRDVILQTLDRVSKRQTLLYFDKRAARRKRIIQPLEVLRKLLPSVKLNRLYDFMLNFDKDGKLKENAYVKKIGNKYHDLKQELYLKTTDDNGVPMTYAPVYNMIAASETEQGRKDIAYNKKLAQVKSTYSNFTRAEKVVKGVPMDGDFHRYNTEFKEQRAKNEVYNSKSFSWNQRSNVPNSQYQKYRAKYYETTYYTKAFRVKGEPTGQVKEDVRFDFVKSDYVEIREIADGGIDMRSSKYTEIMEPKVNDAVAQARRAVYDMFVEEFEAGDNALLNLLPRDVRNQMLGKIPLVVDNLATNLKSDPAKGLFVRLWSKAQSSIKNLTTSTVQQKTVIVNQQGRMVDSFPIMYTGSARAEEILTNLDNQVTQLNEEFKQGKLKLNDYRRERAILEGKISEQKNRPTLGEVSTDLGTSLLLFTDMAEKFESLSEIEGTINALIKVIERREYTAPDQSLFKGVVDKGVFKLKGKLGMSGNQANVVARAHKWANMVFYNNDEISKGFMDKFANAAITWSSQSYVAWNIFGNINNLLIGEVNNAIEGVSNRFMTRKASKRSNYEYGRYALPAAVKRTGAVIQEGADILLGSENAEEGGVKGGVVGAIAGTVIAGPLGTALGAALGGAAGAGLSNTEIKERTYQVDKQTNKYDASAEFWRMMDADMEVRESGLNDPSGQQNRLQRAASIGYLFQDGFEYKLQTTVGNALLMDVQIIDTDTGESSNLYDAQIFDSATGEVSYSDKWDVAIPNYKTGIEYKLPGPITPNSRLFTETRNNIREVAKEIHGNYAAADRTVLQQQWFGSLLFQFKKWLPPALRARYQAEHFNSNLGWMEGRYISSWKLATYFANAMKKGRFDTKNIYKEYKQDILDDNKSRPQGQTGPEGSQLGDVTLQNRLDNKINNVNRTLAEATFLIASYLGFLLLDNAFKDDDNDDSLFEKRLKNWSKYQTDRIYTELILFVPLLGTSEMAGFLERPIASTRVLGSLAEALTLSVRTPSAWLLRDSDETFYQNTNIVYQNNPRKGQLKVYKQWKDALPIIYTLQKAAAFDKMDSFRLGGN